jgi:hypothetical protein
LASTFAAGNAGHGEGSNRGTLSAAPAAVGAPRPQTAAASNAAQVAATISTNLLRVARIDRIAPTFSLSAIPRRSGNGTAALQVGLFN